jgi:hypothetical protein
LRRAAVRGASDSGGLLALIALWQYVCFALSDLRGRASLLRYFLATAAFMLAMLAKPSVIALPLAALAIDRWGVGRPWRKVFASAIAWTAIAIPIAGIARWAQDASNTSLPSLWLRPLIVCDSLAFYMGKLVWPMHLIVDYGRTPASVLRHGSCYWDWIFPVGAAALLIAGSRKRPVLLAAGAIFVAGCLPVLGFTPAMFQFFSTTADHYLYLSMFGPALALAWLLSVRPSFWLRAATVAILLGWITLSIRQGAYWQNDYTLFEHDTEVNPDSYVGYLNLGGDYERSNNFAVALMDFQSAVRANPEYSTCWSNLATAYGELGEIDQAIAAARKSVELQVKYPNLRPNWPGDNEFLGHLLFTRGRYAEAIPYLQTAADAYPAEKRSATELNDARKRAATQPATPSTSAAITPPSPSVDP